MANDSADTSSSPLPLLRKLAIAGRTGEIAFSGDFVVFPDGGPIEGGLANSAPQCPKKRSVLVGDIRRPDCSRKVGEYLKQSRKLHSDPVSVIHRKEVVQYFLGKSDKCSILRKAEATQARKEPAAGANKRAGERHAGREAGQRCRFEKSSAPSSAWSSSDPSRSRIPTATRSFWVPARSRRSLASPFRPTKLLDVSRKRAAGQMVTGDRL